MEFEQLSSPGRRAIAIAHLSRVPRYGIQRVHRQQNVAEHVGRCAMLAATIVAALKHNSPVMTYEDALDWTNLVIFHDLCEAVTGDIVHPVHVEVPELGNLETRVNQVLFNGTFFSGNPKSFQVGRLFCKLIDRLELLMYVKEEVYGGNKHLETLESKAIDIVLHSWEAFAKSFNEHYNGSLAATPQGIYNSFPTIVAIMKGEHCG